ncbi:MAG: phosphatidate cytidylyltransferase [Anaerolineae bacterium]
MLRQRILSAVVLIPLVALIAYLGGYVWLGAISLVGALAALELFRMLREGGHQPAASLGLIGVLLWIASSAPWLAWRADVLLALSTVSTLTYFVLRPTARRATDWAWTLAGILYLGPLLAPFVALRMQPNGLLWLALGVLTTWITDSGAYFVGITFGRHKLAPRLSPKKTWEGAIGGWVVGVLGGGLLGMWLVDLSAPVAFALAGVLCVLAPLGDLAESMIKREIGVKDSGHLIPGHGGMLDRIDSLLFVIPATYYAALWLGM